MRVLPSEAIVTATFGYEIGQQKPEDCAKHQTWRPEWLEETIVNKKGSTHDRSSKSGLTF
jgi:hypothetical protein